MKYRIFVGVVGQAENMQVEPVLETQPTMENNIDDSRWIIFIKTTRRLEKKVYRIHKKTGNIYKRNTRKKLFRTHAAGIVKKKEPEIE